MKKKTIVFTVTIILALAISVFGLIAFLTSGFTVGKITNKVYNVQNVYDELWNLVSSEGHGNNTVLTTATSEAKTVFEMGVFDYIQIPEYHMALSNRTGVLWIHIGTGEYYKDSIGRTREKTVDYEYNCRTKTLKTYYTENETYLIDLFLDQYFEWQKANNKNSHYSLEDLGDYSLIVAILDTSTEKS